MAGFRLLQPGISVSRRNISVTQNRPWLSRYRPTPTLVKRGSKMLARWPGLAIRLLCA